MSWNYRVIRQKVIVDDEEFDSFAIHEVYYDEDGKPGSITSDPVEPSGQTLQELGEDLRRMVAALNKPVLEYDDFNDKE